MKEDLSRRNLLKGIAGAAVAGIGTSEAQALQKKSEMLNFDEKLVTLESEAKQLLSKIALIRLNRKDLADNLSAVPQIIDNLNLERELYGHAQKIGKLVPRRE